MSISLSSPQVIDHYQFDRKIVAIAMNFFVRYINLSSDECDDMERELFEIIPATALYLVIKLFGPKLSRHDNLLLNFVQMSNSKIDESHFVQTEIKMLATFSWHVHPVTPQDFIPYFIKIVSHYNPLFLDEASNKLILIEVSIYIVELIVFEQQFVYDSPSSIAIAAIAIALKSVNTTTATATAKNTNDIRHAKHQQQQHQQRRFGFLLPLFKHNLALSGTVMDLIEKLNLHLTKITPMLDGEGLAVDPTGEMYRKAISS